MAQQDLTGIWQGLYSYGGLGQEIGFTATLLDSGGAIFGTTHEFDPRLAEHSLDASLSGNRAGQTVSFTKVYEAAGEDFQPIAYEGVLSGDGTEVEGTWSIRSAGALSGRFLMSRPRRNSSAEEATRKARKPVDVGAD